VDLGKLDRTNINNPPKFVFVSKKEESTFDLAGGGVSHQKHRDHVHVHPIEYQGLTTDGKFLVYKERSPQAWHWFFSATGSPAVILYAPATMTLEFDTNAVRYPRVP
jgi:hypothetical protein